MQTESHKNVGKPLPKKYKALKRWLLGSTLVLILLFGMGTLWIRYYLDPYLKNWLIEQVHNGTKGTYKLQIKELNFSVWRMSLEVQGVQLHSLKPKESKSLRLDLKAKKVHIKHIAWWTYWTTRKIEVAALILEEPTLDFFNPKIQKSLNIQEIPANLQQFVRTFTPALYIQKIQLKRAKLTLRAGKIFHQFSRLDVTLQALNIATAIRLADFDIQVSDYHYRTPDQLHNLHALSLTARMRDSSLLLRHIHYAPNADSVQQAGKLDKIIVKLPSFEAKGINFNEAFFQQTVKIKHAIVRQPALYIHTKIAKIILEDKATAPIPFPQDLKARLRNFPLYLSIDTLSVRQASFEFRQPVAHHTKEGYHRAKEVNIELHALKIGTHPTQSDTEQNFHIESGSPLFVHDFTFSARDYAHRTASGLYELGIANLYLSSKDSLLRLEKAYLKPLLPAQEIAAQFAYQTIISHGEVLSLLARKVDFDKMIYTQVFRLGSLHLYSPRYEGYLDATKAKQEGQKLRNFEQMLRIIPLDIQADTLAVHQAHVIYKAKQKTQAIATHTLESLNFTVLKIDLGRALHESAIEHIDTKRLYLNIKKYHYQNPEDTYTLEADSVQVHAEKRTLWIRNLSLLPTKNNYKKEKINIVVPLLRGDGIDFVSFMLKQQLDWDKLTVEGAQVTVFTTTKEAEAAIDKKNIQPHNAAFGKIKRVLANLPAYIRLDTLLLKEATFSLQIYDENQQLKARHYVENINGQLLDIALGQASNYDSDSLPHFWNDHSLAFILKQYTYEAQGLTYKFNLKNIRKNAYSSLWEIEALSWKSTLHLNAFRDKFPERRWLAEGTLRSIVLDIPNLEAVIFDKHLAIQQAVIQAPTLTFWLFEATKTAAQKTWWNDLKQDLPLHLSIDTLVLQKAKVTFVRIDFASEKQVPRWTQETELALGIAKLAYKDTLTWASIDIEGKDYTFTNPNTTLKINEWKLLIEPSPRFQAHKMSMAWKSPEGLPESWLKVQEASANFALISLNKPLEMNSLELKDGTGELYIARNTKSDMKALPLSTQTKNFILLTDTLTILNIALKVHHKTPRQTNLHTFTLERGDINQIRWKMQESLPEAKAFSLKIKGYETHLQQYLYRVQAQDLTLTNKHNALYINRLSILPTVTDKARTRLQTIQTELYQTHVLGVSAQGIDLSSFLQDQAIRAQSVTMDSLWVDIYADRRLPRSASRRRRMPAEQLRSVKIPVSIDTLNLLRSAVFYREKVIRAQDEGELFITDINAQFQGIRTRPQAQDSLYLTLKSKLMGLGKTDMHLALALNTPNLSAKIIGNMGEMKADFMNQFLEKTKHVQIRKGKIQSVHFWLAMQDSVATGELEAGYKHLRVDVLSAKKENKKRGFISFLANIFIKNNNNLKKNRHKTGDIMYIRPQNEGFMRFLWRAVVVGIRKTLQ